jgi:hypothetical protein
MKKIYLVVSLVMLLAIHPYVSSTEITPNTLAETWKEVCLIGNISTADPLFYDSTYMKVPLIRQAFSLIQELSGDRHFCMGSIYLINLRADPGIILTTSDYKYSLIETIYLSPREVYAVKLKNSTDNKNWPSLTSCDISDLNKFSNPNLAFPSYYAYDNGYIYFNSIPTRGCTCYVWANRDPSVKNFINWSGLGTPVLPMTNFLTLALSLQITASARGRQGNVVADQNISQIVQSMMVSYRNLMDFIDSQKDKKVMPTILGE